jgi:hypothetical protein
MRSHTREGLSTLPTALAIALIGVVAGFLAGCGPTVYQRAFDYCRNNGGQEYACDRFARDESDHAQQQTAEQIMRGQQAIGGRAARQPTTHAPTLPRYECYTHGNDRYMTCEPR